MTETVEKTLAKNSLSLSGKNVLLAVSGGVDSMAMLHYFFSSKEFFGIQNLYVAHFNHGLRGEESDRDEALVRSYSEQLGVSLFVGKGFLGERKKPKGHSIESWAREERYAFLLEEAGKVGAMVLTAHTMNDLAETVLFHLTRGTGLRGASGIPFQNINVVRPFLDVTRPMILSYIEKHDIPYCLDSSNLQDTFTRNRIRRKVLPELQLVNSKAVENISRFAAAAASADAYLTETAKNLLERTKIKDEVYNAEILKLENDLVLSYAVRELLYEHVDQLDETKIELALDLIHGNRAKLQLDDVFVLVRERETVYISELQSKPTVPYELPAGLGDTILPYGIVVTLEEYDIINKFETDNSRLEFQNVLDCDKIKGSLVFRSRCASDRFQSKRRGLTKSLKKLYNEMHIPIDRRSLYPLLADDDGVVWIIGEGISARVAPDTSTVSAIKISVSEETI